MSRRVIRLMLSYLLSYTSLAGDLLATQDRFI
jgi:hypothetical protein